MPQGCCTIKNGGNVVGGGGALFSLSLKSSKSTAALKRMGILTAEAPLLLLPPFSVGINSYRKEFAPLGANSFFQELTPCKSATSFKDTNKNSCKLM